MSGKVNYFVTFAGKTKRETMKYIRKIIFYEDYFAEFYDGLSPFVQRKVNYVLALVCVEEQIPVKFFKSIEGVAGLFEIRIEVEGNIYRIFCCFDEGGLVVLFNGFQKKSQKTPPREIRKAATIMELYFQSKKKGIEK